MNKSIFTTLLIGFVFHVFSQKIDIKKKEIYLDDIKVGDIYHKVFSDTMHFVNMNQETLLKINYKSIKLPNETFEFFYTEYIDPNNEKIILANRKHKRSFKYYLGEVETLLSMKLMTKDGFDKKAIDHFFETEGGEYISKDEQANVLAKVNIGKTLAQATAEAAKFSNPSYRSEKLAGYTFKLEGNEVYRSATNMITNQNMMRIGRIQIEKLNGSETKITAFGQHQVPLAVGIYNVAAMGPVLFTSYKGQQFGIPQDLFYHTDNRAAVPIFQELHVRDCDFIGTTGENNAVYQPTANEIAVVHLKRQDSLEKVWKALQQKPGVLYLKNGEKIEGIFRLDQTPLGNGNIVNTKLDGGRKIFQKVKNKKGNDIEETISAEDCEKVVFEDDTYDVIKFKPSATSEGSADLGKLLFVKSTERFAARLELNEKVGIYDFEGQPIVYDVAKKEGFSAKDMGAIKKLRERSKDCPQALDDIEKNNYRHYTSALRDWAKMILNCKK